MNPIFPIISSIFLITPILRPPIIKPTPILIPVFCEYTLNSLGKFADHSQPTDSFPCYPRVIHKKPLPPPHPLPPVFIEKTENVEKVEVVKTDPTDHPPVLVPQVDDSPSLNPQNTWNPPTEKHEYKDPVVFRDPGPAPEPAEPLVIEPVVHEMPPMPPTIAPHEPHEMNQ